MKNLFYFLLGAAVVWYWQKRKAKATQAPAEPAQEPAQGTDTQAPAEPAQAIYKSANLSSTAQGTDTQAPAEPAEKTSKIDIIRIYGSPDQSIGNQDLLIDVAPEDAAGLLPGQTISFAKSIIYPGYYKILEILDLEPGRKAIRCNVKYRGSEVGTYIDTAESLVSPFTATMKAKTKSPFIR